MKRIIALISMAVTAITMTVVVIAVFAQTSPDQGVTVTSIIVQGKSTSEVADVSISHFSTTEEQPDFARGAREE